MHRPRWITGPATAALLLVALPAAADEANQAGQPPEPAGYTATGHTQQCVKRSFIRDTRVLDDTTILFVMNGGKVYRNVLPHRCSGLSANRTFSYELPVDRLCNTDVISVLSTGSIVPLRNRCGLGSFELLERKTAEAGG